MDSKKQLTDQLRNIANELDKQNAASADKTNNLSMLNDHVIRPLLECRILKNVEVAKMLHVSPSTVAAMIADGHIDTTRDGKITEYHLWQYLSNQKTNNQ